MDHQLKYHTRVVNTDTGAIVLCGASVPQGTNLRLEFLPREYTDVYWFGTGYANDSPYGEWIAHAAPPAPQCVAKDFVQLTEEAEDGGGLAVFVALIVDPPQESLSGTAGLGCSPAAASNQLCTTPTAGTYAPTSEFASTYGHFYSRYEGYTDNEDIDGPGTYRSPSGQPIIINETIDPDLANRGVDGRDDANDYCVSNQAPMGVSGKNYTTPFTLQVTPQAISCPITVIAADSAQNPPITPSVTASACVVGQAHTINMTTTDPDDDPIQYLIDWDADGTVDQFVPASGYVPSGTTQSASRTYANTGQKSLQVRTADDKGSLSGWGRLAFNCAASAAAGLEVSGNGSGEAGNSVQSPTLDLRAIPSLVRSGNTTNVHWSAQGVVSCSVSGSNGDGWSGLTSPVGGETSRPITAETTYTLSCRYTRRRNAQQICHRPHYPHLPRNLILASPAAACSLRDRLAPGTCLQLRATKSSVRETDVELVQLLAKHRLCRDRPPLPYATRRDTSAQLVTDGRSALS